MARQIDVDRQLGHNLVNLLHELGDLSTDKTENLHRMLAAKDEESTVLALEILKLKTTKDE